MINIIIPLYNSSAYISKTISSVLSQTCSNFRCLIYDDISTDNSVDIIKSLIKKDSRFEIITNNEKYYSCGNHWQALQRTDISDNDNCCTLDGDDKFSDEYVLERVKCYYSNPDVWMTFGQFLIYDGSSFMEGFAKPPNDWNNIRNQGFTYSHLRTFKAGLFKKIKKEDLISPEGCFWEICGDVAMIYPMIEMAGKNRCSFVTDINYLYNVETPLSEAKRDLAKVYKYTEILQNKQRYNTL
jgi:glycosyltransferase involved in cell wall biosynthesis